MGGTPVDLAHATHAARGRSGASDNTALAVELHGYGRRICDVRVVPRQSANVDGRTEPAAESARNAGISHGNWPTVCIDLTRLVVVRGLDKLGARPAARVRAGATASRPVREYGDQADQSEWKPQNTSHAHQQSTLRTCRAGPFPREKCTSACAAMCRPLTAESRPTHCPAQTRPHAYRESSASTSKCIYRGPPHRWSCRP